MSLLNSLLTHGKAVSLNDADIRRICFNQVKFVVYNELENLNVDSFMQLFEPYDSFILFYSTTSNYVGHWTAMILHRDTGVLENFDSYGLKDAQIIQRAADTYNDVEGRPVLTDLMNEASAKYGLKIQWPIRRLQSTNIHDVATCGRYAALRVRFRDLSADQFVKMLTDKRIDTDDLVTLMTVMFSEEADDVVVMHHKR